MERYEWHALSKLPTSALKNSPYHHSLLFCVCVCVMSSICVCVCNVKHMCVCVCNVKHMCVCVCNVKHMCVCV